MPLAWFTEEARTLSSVCLWVFAAGFVSIMFLDEIMEDQVVPSLKDGLSTVARSLDTALTDIKEILSNRFTDIGKAITGGLEGALKQTILTGVSAKEPEVGELLKAGKINEAIGVLRGEAEKTPFKRADLVDLLITSSAVSHWDEAWSVVQRMGNDTTAAKSCCRLSYNYWSVGDLRKAIAIAEAGLKIAERQNRSDVTNLLVNDLRNNLAYFFADAKEVRNAELAKRYADEAYRDAPDDPACLDTKGFVHIVFGETPEEVRQGLSFCAKKNQPRPPGPKTAADLVHRAVVRRAALEQVMAGRL